MADLRKYGESTTLSFSLYEVDGINLRVDAVYASGDVKITKDEGAEANTTNGFVDEGSGYSIVLTATEMEAARVELYIVDQTGTKVWLDTSISVETYGNASAQHAFDLDSAVASSNLLQVNGDTVIADAIENQYDGATGLAGDTYPASQAQVNSILADTADMQPKIAKIPLSDGSITWNSTALASINAECDTALTDYDAATAANLATVDTNVDAILADTGMAIPAQIAGLNDIAATDIVSAGAITTSAGAVSNVTLCATTTTNTDMVSAAPTVSDILTTQMTEAYAADGVAPTLAQSLMIIQQALTEFSISGTTMTVKRIDGSTTAATLTLNDGTNPTGLTRAT